MGIMCDTTSDDLATIEEIARRTLQTLPAPFRAPAALVVLHVVDLPDADLLQALNLDDPMELTGLYEGVALTEKSPSEPAPLPEVIWLFRKPILAELAERPDVTLAELVQHVTIHELAHHFGWSDADIAKVDEWWT